MGNSKTLRLCIFLALFLSLGIVFFLSQKKKESQSTTKVVMLDVGQGDSFFIEAKNGRQLLIDTGKDTRVLGELAEVMSPFDKSIDVLVLTHPDMDHVGGADSIIGRYRVGAILVSGVSGDTEEYKNLLSLIEKKNIPLYIAIHGTKVSLSDEESFTVLFPDRDVYDWETNNASIVGVFKRGDRSVLFTGDSPVWIEQYLSKTYPSLIDVDILKLGHHGSRTSTSAVYLKTTTPRLALISAGKNNSYGHPHREVLDLLKQFNIPHLSTQTEGTVFLETDGVKWWRVSR